jgi:uncharacterized protein YciI
MWVLVGFVGKDGAMYLVLFYDLVDDYLGRRVPLRPEHLELARAAHERGELAIAGALDDPADQALLVFATEDPSVVQRFVDADPYVREGLVTSLRIRKWNVVIGPGAAR